MDWATGAAVIVAIAAILGILIQFFKKDKPWREITEDHSLRVTKLETEIKFVQNRVDTLSEQLEDHDARDQKDFERVENKIEKLTDLMIQLIQEDSRKKPNTTKTRK